MELFEYRLKDIVAMAVFETLPLNLNIRHSESEIRK
jgi:hypothetical protein